MIKRVPRLKIQLVGWPASRNLTSGGDSITKAVPKRFLGVDISKLDAQNHNHRIYLSCGYAELAGKMEAGRFHEWVPSPSSRALCPTRSRQLPQLPYKCPLGRFFDADGS